MIMNTLVFLFWGWGILSHLVYLVMAVAGKLYIFTRNPPWHKSLLSPEHINNITSKAGKWLYFLKQLKRAKNQLHFYTAAIQQVLEYAAPVWHQSSIAHRLRSWHQLKKELYI